MEALNDHGKALKGARIMVLGIAYKKNIDDMRESPARAVMDLLIKAGADLCYNDPYVPEIPTLRGFDVKMASTEVTAGALEAMDAVLVLTDHDNYDYKYIAEHSKLVVDTRGRYRGSHSNIVKA
jgi:UDP-N-acetyl-D-glucosamine dehydrogenase